METNNYNFEIIKSIVRTQYGDYGGLLEIDGHNGADLFKLCEDHGIDMKKYFLIGFGFGESSTNGIGNYGKIYCSALLLDSNIYGDTYDLISKYLMNNNNKVRINRISFYVKYSDLGKYIKRIDAMVVTKLSQHINNFEIIDLDE
jgi:hypothetical protein